MANSLKVKDRLSGFTVTSITDLEEYGGKGILLEHDKTGAQVYHLSNADQENLFGFAFKTVPENDTGVAHILEHTVLCGSKDFPVKDPFLLLVKGSMNTFLNALTFPDKTLYPASSMVEKDLFNIMEVYGDAVFFPLLKEEMFNQEGHRLEFDQEGNLQRTGVVYNEMKGVYSSPDDIEGELAISSLFDDTLYRFDSGGNPKAIPELTYEEFKKFHETHYHPSNCLIFLYGNIPTERYLSFLEEKFLHRFNSKLEKIVIPTQKKWTEPKRIEATYPASHGPLEKQSTININWLLDEVADPLRILSYEVLSDLLLGTASSPIQRAILEADFGQDLSASSGVMTVLKQATFSIGMRGTDPDKEKKLEDLVFSTLRAIVADGFDKELLEASVRRFEFYNREIKGGSPFGLRLMRKSLRGWLHGHNPELSMEFQEPMEELKIALVKNHCYFEELIESEFLNNPHYTTLVIKPDSKQNEREAKIEQDSLKKIKEDLSDSSKEAILAMQKKLRQYQETPDDPEILERIPFLTLSDVPKEVQKIGNVDWKPDSIPAQKIIDFTNGVSYIELSVDIKDMNSHLKDFLSLFSTMINSVGSNKRDYEDMSKKLGLYTGGFNLSAMTHPKEGDKRDYHAKVSIRIKALHEYLGQALTYVSELLEAADFSDYKRMFEVFIETKNDMKSSISYGGSSYAAFRASRKFGSAARWEERWRGLSQYMFLESLDQWAHTHEDPSRQLGELLELCFNEIALLLLEKVRHSLIVTTEGHHESMVLDLVETWHKKLKSTKVSNGNVEEALDVLHRYQTAGESYLGPEPSNQPEALIFPSKVSFSAVVLPASHFDTKDHAAEDLLAHLLGTGFLWEEIRMKGGAYGAFAKADGFSEVFTFASYRDPNIIDTWKKFKAGLEFLAANPVEERELELAKIGYASSEIKPLAPGQKTSVAIRRWLFSIKDELRQKKRDNILALTADDIVEAAKRLLNSWDHRSVAVLSGQELIDQNKSAASFTPVIWNIGR